MKSVSRSLLFILALVPMLAFAQSTKSDPITPFTAMQAKYAPASDFFGVMKWEKAGGDTQSGNFWVRGELYRLQLGDREYMGDGTYAWEIHHRDRKIKKRHYDPHEAPAVVHALRLVRLDLESESVTLASKAQGIGIDIENGSSVAQGSHLMSLDPKTGDITAFVLHENQGSFLERVELGQVRTDLSFATETYGVNPEDWKKKGYTLLDMAQGENFTILPEEKALRPAH